MTLTFVEILFGILHLLQLLQRWPLAMKMVCLGSKLLPDIRSLSNHKEQTAREACSRISAGDEYC